MVEILTPGGGNNIEINNVVKHCVEPAANSRKSCVEPAKDNRRSCVEVVTNTAEDEPAKVQVSGKKSESGYISEEDKKTEELDEISTLDETNEGPENNKENEDLVHLDESKDKTKTNEGGKEKLEPLDENKDDKTTSSEGGADDAVETAEEALAFDHLEPETRSEKKDVTKEEVEIETEEEESKAITRTSVEDNDKETETKESETQETKIAEPDTKESETQENRNSEPETKESETQETKNAEHETEEPETDESKKPLLEGSPAKGVVLRNKSLLSGLLGTPPAKFRESQDDPLCPSTFSTGSDPSRLLLDLCYLLFSRQWRLVTCSRLEGTEESLLLLQHDSRILPGIGQQNLAGISIGEGGVSLHHLAPETVRSLSEDLRLVEKDGETQFSSSGRVH